MRTFRIKAKTVDESVIVCRKNAFEGAGRPDFLFTDSNVFSLYKKKIGRYFPDAPLWAMPAGEENKTPETLFALLSEMAKAGLTRKATLLCLGGGVIGDIGGLASALYMRGISCIQVPTTLLSQVDSSVGGKTAVDFCGIKNLIGAFRQPKTVLVDGAFLKTLPPREIRCGLGEIVKHGALSAPLFDKLWEHRENLTDLAFLNSIVPDNIAFKSDVVRKDPTERGLRKCLNLGHTTGHAFELADGKLSHGEYVLAGILFEAELARRHLACDGEYLDRLGALVRAALGDFPALPPAEEAARRALLDKKNVSAGEVVLTVPLRKGEYALLSLPYENYLRELTQIQEGIC
ncbi:MAG: 3-dehydroquinate synthase family protein [Candidatus Gallimonas sp.]